MDGDTKAIKEIITVNAGENISQRIDSYLTKFLGDKFSRSRLQQLIKEGFILINGKKVKSSYKTSPGDRITIAVPEPESWDVVPEDIPLKIVYQDEDILVINKEKGMVVHPAAGHRSGTLVNAVLNICPDLTGIGGTIRPGIVHRLDKNTTGLIVVAKNERSLKFLQTQMKNRKIKREYIALCKGCFSSDTGSVNAPIARHPVNRKKMAVVKQGREAITDYRVITRFGSLYTLVFAMLKTGRTHQIRVHMAYIGHPIIGDSVYGRTKGELGLQSQALHAFKLGFNRPSDNRYIEFSGHIPDEFRSALKTLECKFGKELPQWIS